MAAIFDGGFCVQLFCRPFGLLDENWMACFSHLEKSRDTISKQSQIRSTVNKCSAVPFNVTLVSCGQHNTTRDECLGWGCCWNSSSSVNATRCYGIANNQSVSNSTHTTSVPMTTEKTTSTSGSLSTTAGPEGTCQVYRGQVCYTWLNFTMLEYRWKPRFIDNRFGLNGTEGAIMEFMYAINRIDGQEMCKRILKALLCEYFLPPCNEDNERHSYCREDCEAVMQDCYSAMIEVLGAAKYIVEKLGLEFAHVGVPNCTKLRYSADYEAENTTCVHFGLFNFTTAEPTGPTVYDEDSESRINSTAIILSIIGVFILFCIGIVVRFHRRCVSGMSPPPPPPPPPLLLLPLFIIIIIVLTIVINIVIVTVIVIVIIINFNPF
ncbi:hypothetical protein ACROYT_G028946 [Oculina patagonica]